MKNSKKVLSLSLAATMLGSATTAFAMPADTVVIGDKAFEMAALSSDNAELQAEINAAILDADAIYYNIDGVTEGFLNADGDVAMTTEAQTALKNVVLTKADGTKETFANFTDESGTVVEQADLTAYTAALNTVTEANYTAASWTTYQAVVTANVVTVSNTQAEVDAATAKILEAQKALVSNVKLAVDTVTAVTNTVVDVTLTTAAQTAMVSDFMIKDSSNTVLAISNAELSTDGKTVTLTTAAQTTGSSYTLTAGTISKAFVGGVADTAAPTAVVATATKNTTVTATFTDANRLDVTSATNVSNYTIPGITVESATVTGKVVTLTTSAQTVGSVYTLSVNGVKDVAGNAITTALTSSFAGKGADTVAPTTATATSYNNTKIVVLFNEDIDPTTATTLSNYTIAGLTPTAVEFVSTDADASLYSTTKNRAVVLTTPVQTTGSVYTLSVLGVKDTSNNAITTALTSTFAGKGADAVAPTLSSATAYNNTTVIATFNENLDATSANTVANYTIAGLTPTVAKLITTTADVTLYGGTINKSVVLTTPAQTAGTVYTLSVLGVKDVAGNAITTAGTSTFAGKNADTVVPTITNVTALAGNKLQVVFSETMNSASVQTLTNYSITGLGYPVSVDTWTASTNTLVLNTAAQTNGTIYTMTTTGVQDVAGNAVAANTTNNFAGIGTALDAPALNTVTALDSQRIKVVFNKDLDNTTVDITDFVLYKGSGSTTDILADNTGESITKISNSEYVIFLGTAAADKLVSDVYKLKITGVMSDIGGTALSTSDATKNEKTFGGVDTAAAAPAIVSMTQTDARTLVATFNQEMKLSAFTASNVTVSYDSITPINHNGTTATVNSTDKTKVTFKFASDIAANKVAKLNILAADFDKFNDITGEIAMVKNATTNYEVQFGTQEFVASTLKLSTVTAVDEQTLELAFSTPITFNGGAVLTNPGAGTDANFMAITKNSDGSAVTHDFKYAEQTDDTHVRVYYTNTGMAEGTIYKLAITDNAAGDELFVKASDGTKLDAATVANASATFGYNGTVNAAPYLVSATPLSSNVVQLTFSESLNAVPTTDGTNTTDIEIYNGATQVAAGSLTDAVDLGTDKKSLKVTLSDGVFAAGTTYTVKVPKTVTLTDKYGVDTIKTNTDALPTQANVSFGGAGTALVAPVAASLGFTNDAVDGEVVNVIANIPTLEFKTLELFAHATTVPTGATTATATADLTGAAKTASATLALSDGITIAAGDKLYYRYVDAAGNKTAWTADGDVDAITAVGLVFGANTAQDKVKANTAAGLSNDTYVVTTAGGNNTVATATITVTAATTNAEANFGSSVLGVTADNGSVTVTVTDSNGNTSTALAAGSVTVE